MCDIKEPLRRLRELIDNSGKSRQQIAKDLKCDTSTITKHYNGKRGINADFIVKYAKYFNVTADYLLGLSDTPSTDEKIKGICDFTGLNERFINDFLKDDLLSKRYFLDFINSIGESDTLSDDFDSMLFYLNDYITAVKKIQAIQKESEKETFETFLIDGIADDISAAIDERDIAKYRVEDKFKKIIQEYSGDNQISHIRDFFT